MRRATIVHSGGCAPTGERGSLALVFRLVGALVLVLAALAAGCGGGGDDDESAGTTEWADGVCTALADWGTSIRDVTGSATSGTSAERLQAIATDVKEATEKLADDLEGLGRPGTDAGEQAQDEIEELAADMRQDVEKIEDAAGSGNAVTAATTISSTLSTMSSQLGSTLNELEQLDAQGELSDAFEEADACQDLANSTS
jgi:hypothetical protein